MIYIPDPDSSNAHTAVAYLDSEATPNVSIRSQPVFAAIGEDSLNFILRGIVALGKDYFRLMPALALREHMTCVSSESSKLCNMKLPIVLVQSFIVLLQKDVTSLKRLSFLFNYDPPTSLCRTVVGTKLVVNDTLVF